MRLSYGQVAAVIAIRWLICILLPSLFPTGWKLKFRGPRGMGDIEQGGPDDDFHGVLHLLTPEQFLILDKIEGAYVRTLVQVTLYDGSTVDAYAYKMDEDKLKDMTWAAVNNPPDERYIDLIRRGCQHYGVDPAYIDRLNQIPAVPRRHPSTFKKLPSAPDVPISRARLEAGVGPRGVHEMLVSVRGKVLKWIEGTNEAAGGPASSEWARNNLCGKEACYAISKTAYEPLYPVPTCYEDMAEGHKDWAEDLFCEVSGAKFPLPEGETIVGHWEIIGRLED